MVVTPPILSLIIFDTQKILKLRRARKRKALVLQDKKLERESRDTPPHPRNEIIAYTIFLDKKRVPYETFRCCEMN